MGVNEETLRNQQLIERTKGNEFSFSCDWNAKDQVWEIEIPGVTHLSFRGDRIHAVYAAEEQAVNWYHETRKLSQTERQNYIDWLDGFARQVLKSDVSGWIPDEDRYGAKVDDNDLLAMFAKLQAMLRRGLD